MAQKLVPKHLNSKHVKEWIAVEKDILSSAAYIHTLIGNQKETLDLIAILRRELNDLEHVVKKTVRMGSSWPLARGLPTSIRKISRNEVK